MLVTSPCLRGSASQLTCCISDNRQGLKTADCKTWHTQVCKLCRCWHSTNTMYTMIGDCDGDHIRMINADIAAVTRLNTARPPLLNMLSTMWKGHVPQGPVSARVQCCHALLSIPEQHAPQALSSCNRPRPIIYDAYIALVCGAELLVTLCCQPSSKSVLLRHTHHRLSRAALLLLLLLPHQCCRAMQSTA